ncbi:MAG: hypothetical protein ACOX2W_05730 [Desulfomonilia bacterium]|jgi:hypothetical protein|nr:hypothetical protein [Deltaproteobacteria bacterium]
MKRLLAALTVLLVLVPTLCSAEGYVMVNYGIGGDIDEPSLGVEMGGIFLSRLHPEGGAVSFGLGVSVADTDEHIPSAALPSVPAPAYDQFTKYNDGNEQEVYVSIGAEMIPALFAVAGVGYASQDTVLVGRYADQLYEVDSESDNNITWMLGMRYIIQGLNVGLGYHSRRGILAGIGVAF